MPEHAGYGALNLDCEARLLDVYPWPWWAMPGPHQDRLQALTKDSPAQSLPVVIRIGPEEEGSALVGAATKTFEVWAFPRTEPVLYKDAYPRDVFVCFHSLTKLGRSFEDAHCSYTS